MLVAAGIFLYKIGLGKAKLFLLHLNLSFAGFLMLSVYFNFLKKAKTARLITLIVSPLFILMASCTFGSNAKVAYYFLVTATLPLIFYSKKQVILFFWIINLLFFIFDIWFHTKYIAVLQRDNAPAIFDYLNPVIVFILLSAIIMVFKKENLTNESALEKQNKFIKKQADELIKLNDIKSKLYTNISHEFRTPLTLISMPVQNLLTNETEPAKQKIYTRIIQNCNQLLNLINQMLELSKLDAGAKKLHMKETDIMIPIKTSIASFESFAETRNIQFSFVSKVKELFAIADPEKIQLILNNLLANAFKFTPKGGSISVMVECSEDNNARLIVKDSGKGIPAQHLSMIFDRFYFLSHSETGENASSGIGLELTKELVELHGGNISVESRLGIGSSFIIHLPILLSIFDSTENQHIEYSGKLFENKKKTDNSILCQSESESIEEHSKKIILIVEDNFDMRQYLSEFLSEKYRIIDAGNGKEALVKAIETIPDLIISDVMMPEMDGIEFCRIIRDNEKTQHIPLIMLTAKTQLSSRIEGRDSGADYYLEKPFNTNELQLILANLLRRQEQLIKYHTQRLFHTAQNQEIQSVKDQFLDKLKKIIEDHLDDSELSTENLCKNMGYSRSQLYRKTKALTNTSPNEFIRNIRLKHAANLLKKKAGNISEICYSVGFTKPSYFSECFKNLYGSTPTEYLETYHKT